MIQQYPTRIDVLVNPPRRRIFSSKPPFSSPSYQSPAISITPAAVSASRRNPNPMDEVKDKMKSLMKKVNNPFSSSSSSSKFHGRGRLLGSGPATSPATPAPPPLRPSPPPSSAPKPAAPAPKPSSPAGSFDPFDPLIASSRRAATAPEVPFVCPVCDQGFVSEQDVSAHLDSCLVDDGVAGRVSRFMAGSPGKEAVEVALKLLKNVAREPENEKFRRLRMGNEKIKTVGETEGGVELLECVGFGIGEEGGELWATMEVPNEQGVYVLKQAAALLERWRPELRSEGGASSTPELKETENVGMKKLNDRKVRVFFAVPESVAANIDLPDSFYNLSADEVKREAHLRNKKIEESRLLVPKSYREKQALAAQKKHKLTVIRIQFPDGVVLEGQFAPTELTTALYEFVSTSLKDPSLEFELLEPMPPRPRVIPRFPRAGEKPPTLGEVGLVPNALLRCKPLETESVVYTGLSNDFLEKMEPQLL